MAIFEYYMFKNFKYKEHIRFRLMGLFKKYLTECENKEIINIMNLYMDIEQYNSLDKTAKGKRDTQAGFICRSVLYYIS